jgi:DNA-directed RNA polymerase II subunit RPB1
MNHKYSMSSAPVGTIKQLQFSIMGGEEIIKHSVVEIVSTDLYNKGYPMHGGLYDLRMGTTDKQYMCQTCKCDVVNCQGHFGHIVFNQPVYNICYFKTVYKIIQVVCMKCSSFLCNTATEHIKNPSKKFKHAYDTVKKQSVCKNCEFVQPKWIMDGMQILYEFQPVEPEIKTTNVLSARFCVNILRKLTDVNCKKMGFCPVFSHPKNMIITILPVPPPVVRPCVILDTVMKSQDDLTHKLIEILKSNEIVKKYTETVKNKENHKQILQEYINLLQFHVTTYIDNDIPGLPQSTQRIGRRPIKSITQRLKTKEGRIRGNLMGKRVDFSARTVITADPNIDLDELGVPYTVSRNLTFPDRVTSFNKAMLQAYVDNGPEPANIKDVGANYVMHENGICKDLRFCKTGNIVLQIGDIVERHMRDGDLVIFNRQPSLHKMSMMGHKVRRMPFNTFRLNLSVTSPYNADFDGDEMNLHMCQTHDAMTEINELMKVSKCIVSSQSNKPVMGIVQDSLLACRIFTIRDVFVNKETMMNIACLLKNPYTIPHPTILKPKLLWTGKQLIDLILPKTLQLGQKNSDWHNEDIETTPGFSICDTEIIIRNGELLCGTLCKKTLGASSCGIIHLLWLEQGDEVAARFISDIQYVANAWLLETGFTVGASDCVNTPSTSNEVDNIIKNATKSVTDLIDKHSLSKAKIKPEIIENKINSILNNARDKSGVCVQNDLSVRNNIYTMVTGGSKGSVINIAQIMGCVGQQNVNGKRIEYGYNHRTLPHFNKYSNDAESRGFVANSYLKGLSPSEFFFHAMGGREGIIDTAIKTSETGYIQRRLIKSMEDLYIATDNTVRNSNKDILQFLYGEDGFDGSRLISQNIPKNMNQHNDTKCCLPIHFNRIINSAMQIIHPEPTKVVYEDVKEELKITKENINKHSMIFSTLFDNYIDQKLVESLSVSGLKWLLEEIEYKIQHAKVQYGEMVGTLAAQSLGSPITQMTLNTFHSAGISAKNVTLGVPRLKELINISKNLKNPSLTISLNTLNSSVQIRNHLKCTLLNEFFVSINLLYKEPFEPFEQLYYGLTNTTDDAFTWCIRMIINIEHLKEKHLQLLDITCMILKIYPDVSLVYNSENEKNVMIMMRTETDKYTYDEIKYIFNKFRTDTILKGYKEIKDVYVKNDTTIETDGGSFLEILGDSMIDPYNTLCNDVLSVYTTLGIEAARETLLNELQHVIEFDGSYVNYRHIALLVDTMTHKGKLMAITRHGMNRTNAGTLMKCSFEETVNILTDAAVFASVDNLNGVTENIMLGKSSKLGTGQVDVFLDISKLNPPNDKTEEPEPEPETYEEDHRYFRPSTPTYSNNPCMMSEMNRDETLRTFFT